MKRRKEPKTAKDDSGPQLIGYARCSDREQNLNLQLDALHKAGCLNIYQEHVSGASKKRPQLDLAIKDLRPGDTFVVWRLDRIARSMLQMYQRFDQIAQAGCSFKSLTEHFDFSTATGKLLVAVTAAYAEFERQVISARTIAGIEAARLRGGPHGAPIKFTEKKRKVARRLLKLKGKRHMKRRAIAKRLGISTGTLYLWIKGGMK